MISSWGFNCIQQGCGSGSGSGSGFKSGDRSSQLGQPLHIHGWVSYQKITKFWQRQEAEAVETVEAEAALKTTASGSLGFSFQEDMI